MPNLIIYSAIHFLISYQNLSRILGKLADFIGKYLGVKKEVLHAI